MKQIRIKAGNETYAADFKSVRKIRKYSIGWASVRKKGYSFTFPTIITPWPGHTLTVSDWQAPWLGIDLTDPTQVRKMIRTGQGRFYNPRTGRDSDIAKQFSSSYHYQNKSK